MTYVTIMQSPRHHQITLEELLAGINDFSAFTEPMNTNTRTYVTENLNQKLLEKIDVNGMISYLKEFNDKYRNLFEADRLSLYHSFSIPKKSGGLRRIDAPNVELMEALRQLKHIFETKFFAKYHTSAFAYVRGRSTIDSIKRHQQNASKWFVKLDFSNFFGTTTTDFVLSQLATIFPFSEVMKLDEGRVSLEKALSLCFLNGGLPQGTPISPLLTNLVMLPIDHKLSNTLRDYKSNCYVFTRYADDILISSKYNFDSQQIHKYVVDVVKEFNAPYILNPEKTRYGSSAGSNWNLGIMLNKDNDITIGHRKKKQFKAMIHNFMTDFINNVPWELSDVQEMSGLMSYYKMIEKPYINYILNSYSKKFKIDVRQAIKSKLK